MAKRDRLTLSPHQFIETSRDLNGRYFIAYSSGSSVFIRDTKELRKFLRLPKGIPSREAFDAWITSLEAMDAERSKPAAPEGLSQEYLATGFGPEAHLDESDPQYQTRTVI